ncbi:MAG: hypothetical protein ABIZ49_13075 [Opitutaceae bacterium]
MSDAELLQRHTRENSQAAFATLVARHLDLVYFAAHHHPSLRFLTGVEPEKRPRWGAGLGPISVFLL